MLGCKNDHFGVGVENFIHGIRRCICQRCFFIFCRIGDITYNGSDYSIPLPEGKLAGRCQIVGLHIERRHLTVFQLLGNDTVAVFKNPRDLELARGFDGVTGINGVSLYGFNFVIPTGEGIIVKSILMRIFANVEARIGHSTVIAHGNVGYAIHHPYNGVKLWRGTINRVKRNIFGDTIEIGISIVTVGQHARPTQPNVVISIVFIKRIRLRFFDALARFYLNLLINATVGTIQGDGFDVFDRNCTVNDLGQRQYFGLYFATVGLELTVFNIFIQLNNSIRVNRLLRLFSNGLGFLRSGGACRIFDYCRCLTGIGNLIGRIGGHNTGVLNGGLYGFFNAFYVRNLGFGEGGCSGRPVAIREVVNRIDNIHQFFSVDAPRILVTGRCGIQRGGNNKQMSYKLAIVECLALQTNVVGNSRILIKTLEGSVKIAEVLCKRIIIFGVVSI